MPTHHADRAATVVQAVPAPTDEVGAWPEAGGAAPASSTMDSGTRPGPGVSVLGPLLAVCVHPAAPHSPREPYSHSAEENALPGSQSSHIGAEQHPGLSGSRARALHCAALPFRLSRAWDVVPVTASLAAVAACRGLNAAPSQRAPPPTPGPLLQELSRSPWEENCRVTASATSGVCRQRSGRSPDEKCCKRVKCY